MNNPTPPATMLPDGAVRVTRNDLGGLPWYLVELGRARYVKRFNLLSPAEASQLIAQLRGLGIDG